MSDGDDSRPSGGVPTLPPDLDPASAEAAMDRFFAGLGERMAQARPAPAAPVAPAEVRPNPLKSTAPLLEAAPARWPFLPAAGPAEGGDEEQVPRTMPVPVRRGKLGETSPLDGDVVQRAVKALPFAGSEATGVVTFPRLSAREFVSLRLRLRAGVHREAVLKEYGVTSEAALRALVEDWKDRMKKDAELFGQVQLAMGEVWGWVWAAVLE